MLEPFHRLMVREVTGCGHIGALCLGTAAIMAVMSAQHAGPWQGRWHLELSQPPGPVRVDGLLVPGGLQVDTWSRHFQWTLSCFCFRNYSMLNDVGPVCPGLVQTL